MAGYVFIENSNKPVKEVADSKGEIILDSVSLPCIEAALKKGYDVVLGVNRNYPEELYCTLPISFYDSHTYRSITAIGDNIIAFKNLSKVIREYDIEVIHCNTPIGGLVGRICGKVFKVKTIIYTAHGFHFYKGAPLINRTLFKAAEYIMAKWTDVIITMNEEDYSSAQKMKKGSKHIYKVHGVGIDVKSFELARNNRKEKRKELKLCDEDIAIVSAGDLIKRKNYSTSIKAIAECKNHRIHYFICGKGPEEEHLISLIKDLHLENQVHLLGFRPDVKDIMGASDIFLFTTLQEGLPRSLMEAMACGLPCIASKVRGNVDLIEDRVNGILCDAKDINQFANAIMTLCSNKTIREQYAEKSIQSIRNYDVSVVKKEILEIYSKSLG